MRRTSESDYNNGFFGRVSTTRSATLRRFSVRVRTARSTSVHIYGNHLSKRSVQGTKAREILMITVRYSAHSFENAEDWNDLLRSQSCQFRQVYFFLPTIMLDWHHESVNVDDDNSECTLHRSV